MHTKCKSNKSLRCKTDKFCQLQLEYSNFRKVAMNSMKEICFQLEKTTSFSVENGRLENFCHQKYAK